MGVLLIVVGVVILAYLFFSISQPIHNTPEVFRGGSRGQNVAVVGLIGAGLLIWGLVIVFRDDAAFRRCVELETARRVNEGGAGWYGRAAQQVIEEQCKALTR